MSQMQGILAMADAKAKPQITYYDVRKKLEAMAKELEAHEHVTLSDTLKSAAGIVFNYFEGTDTRHYRPVGHNE